MLATALLHVAGIVLGYALGRVEGRAAYRLAGSAVALAGFVILSTII